VGKLLADYQQPHLDVAIDEALQGYIAQREEQIYPRLG
jgi:trimethylamine:corrinoid methyltransferase-like protein